MNNDIGITITAIIPVFNGKKYLKIAIESIVYQTYNVNELIIIDDGSTDNSLESIEGMNAPFPIYKIKQKNVGQSAARNNGVKLAKSEFIAFLDQDDYWLPQHIEKLAAPFRSDPTLGWVYSNLNQIDEDGKTINIELLNYSPSTHPKRQLTACLGHDLFILPSATIIRKSAFDQIGGFDERLSGYEDDDLFLRLFRNGWNNTYLNVPLSAWRSHQSSSSYSKRMQISRRIYADKLLENFSDNNEFGLYYRRDYIAPRFYKIAKQEYMRGVRIKKIELCKESYIDIIKYAAYFKLSIKEKIIIGITKYPKLFILVFDFLYRK
ncbi:MAG: glycosyltransferase family A protein [bacterium]